MATWRAAAIAAALAGAACGGGSGSERGTPTSADDVTTTTEAADEVDLTGLPVGDDSVSSEPGVGLLWSCQTTFSGGGAQAPGPWFNGDGTWNAEAKATVDGDVAWPTDFDVTVQGDTRVIAGNDLPDHPTGEFPVAPTDDAYQYDRNPNSITEQDVALELPATPTLADQPQCVGGEVGVLLTGSVLFNAVDAGGRDANAWEVQDGCDGHPQVTGVYHYHGLSDCAEDGRAGGHSVLVGYAFDGFGIFGHYGEDGEVLTNAELDACHGHTHEIDWDGQTVEMYHYHATYEFPYTVGCSRGATVTRFGGNGAPPPPQP